MFVTATRRPLCDYTIPAHENAQLEYKNNALYSITGVGKCQQYLSSVLQALILL